MSGSSTVSYTARAIAEHVAAELVGSPDAIISRPDAIDDATQGTLTFLRSPKFASKWATSHATAALLTRDLSQIAGEPGQGRALLYVRNVDDAMARVLDLFAPPPPPLTPTRHPSALIDPAASVHPSATIGPYCIVSHGAHVGAHTHLVAQVYLGPNASVGQHCTLHPGVRVLDRCVIGDRCILHPGVCIGADGFGYRATDSGPAKVPHIGNVVLGNDVEIGANACIDRAKFSSTSIGHGTKIDNLVQIGHNCRIGRCCIICGHTGIAGSVILGDGVVLGGNVGIADNVEIGPGAMLTGNTSATNDLPGGGVYMGIPATPIREARRNYVAFRNLAKSISDLKKRLGSLDGPNLSL
jgi:UDP-3-O-[3-hydroxymyristoyl] glucosamine N-acyltransferase